MALGLNCDPYKTVIHFTRESWGCLWKWTFQMLAMFLICDCYCPGSTGVFENTYVFICALRSVYPQMGWKQHKMHLWPISFVSPRSHWPAMGVLYIYNYESSIPSFCYCVYTWNKRMLFGTNIKGAGKRVSIVCVALWTALLAQKFSFYIQWNDNTWNYFRTYALVGNHISKNNSSFSAICLICIIHLRIWNKHHFLVFQSSFQ